MSDDFTFDDDTKGVLDKALELPKSKATSKNQKSRGGRPLSTADKKTERVQCYLTKTEYAKLEELLDGRPASVYFRNLLLRELRV